MLSAPTSGRRVSLPFAAAVGSLIALAAHMIYVIAGPERRLMDWLYDDCFYYVVTAGHLAMEGLSSFDGLTRTSGYHPLWMAVCTVLYRAHPHLDLTLLRLGMGITSAITLSLLITALLWARRQHDTGWLWSLAIASTSYNAWNNGFTIMEWPLVVLSWALLHRLLQRSSTQGSYRVSLMLAACGIGLLGSLSRTDFGLVPACYAVAAMLVTRRLFLSPGARLATAAVAGSAAGLGLTFLFHHAMTGTWVQQSAVVKAALSANTLPFSPVPAAWEFSRAILFLPPLSLGPEQQRQAIVLGAVPLFIVAVVIAVLLFRARHHAASLMASKDPTSLWKNVATVAAALGMVGYVIVYSFNTGATYPWYTACVTGFLLVLVARVLGAMRPRSAAVIALIILAFNLAVAATGRGANAETQYSENIAGKLLQGAPADAVLGGGDVGKPSFLNGGGMINTDGLMNNEAVPYLLAGRIHCYVLARHIGYLTDVGTVSFHLTNAIRARHGERPLPWDLYFPLRAGSTPDGVAGYVVTNFAAITSSGECGTERLAGRTTRLDHLR